MKSLEEAWEKIQPNSIYPLDICLIDLKERLEKLEAESIAPYYRGNAECGLAYTEHMRLKKEVCQLTNDKLNLEKQIENLCDLLFKRDEKIGDLEEKDLNNKLCKQHFEAKINELESSIKLKDNNIESLRRHILTLEKEIVLFSGRKYPYFPS